ncbi:hypothetical protein ALC60_11042 [Trachymyrmex zeteki]|uniref:Uncharacterized protein n=1 Tax=Mycetomoellerius zeteki TaxID=64791 RepID=A0A151WPY3_9HYME|nr:hypothetical protein ALC60_11042 [Trachymyrmex zeteki]
MVYKISCLDRDSSYVDQTKRKAKTRIKEYKANIKKSKVASHRRRFGVTFTIIALVSMPPLAAQNSISTLWPARENDIFNDNRLAKFDDRIPRYRCSIGCGNGIGSAKR